MIPFAMLGLVTGGGAGFQGIGAALTEPEFVLFLLRRIALIILVCLLFGFLAGFIIGLATYRSTQV